MGLMSFEMEDGDEGDESAGRKKERYLKYGALNSTSPSQCASIKALLLMLPYPQQLLCILSINMANAAAKKAAAGKCGL